jgi:predicted MFS family arabinose efflux permease
VPVGAALVFAAPRVLPETERRRGHFDLTGAFTSTAGMTAIVYGIVRAGTAGWSDRITVASLTAGLALLGLFVLTERRAAQPITPLRLFSSRERVGAYVARVLFVGGMFGVFFFISQYLQGVLRFSPIEAGAAFLPLTLMIFGTTQFVPGLVARFGNTRVLTGGILTALVGMVWLSRIGPDTSYVTGVAIPMAILGVAPEDAGAASGLVNVAHQLGGSLGLGVLVTVFASSQSADLAHAISLSLTAGSVMLALALVVVLAVIRRPRQAAVQPIPLREGDVLVDELAA